MQTDFELVDECAPTAISPRLINLTACPTSRTRDVLCWCGMHAASYQADMQPLINRLAAASKRTSGHICARWAGTGPRIC